MPKAIFTGPDRIMSGYDTFIKKYPYYSLWHGNVLTWQGGNTQEDRTEVEEMIEAAEQSGNTDIIYLRFYDKGTKGPVTNKTAFTSTMTCQAVAKQGRYDNGIGAVSDGRLPREQYLIIEALKDVTASFKSIDARLTELEGQEEVEAVEDTFIGKVGSFLQTPVGEMLLTRLLPPGGLGALMGNPAPNAQVSGTGKGMPEAIAHNGDASADHIAENSDSGQLITEDQIAKIDAIIARLALHCDVVNDLELLARLAETQPQMFKMLLSQLRAV